MKVLFIGGNGNISWWCVQRCIDAGNEVYELNRGITRATRRPVQKEVKEIIADVRDEVATENALSSMKFDVVCDFICFDGEQAKRAKRLFGGRCDHYIVISSEGVYQRKSKYLPFRETTPLYEPGVGDKYIWGKIEVENEFRKAYTIEGFPVTIVRPGYTYDTIIQMPVGQNCFTAPKRLLEGYPLLMPGEGENLVAPLHSKDFAEAFYALLDNQKVIGESFHIAADWLITWNEMAEYILDALGCDRKKILHIQRDEALNINDFYSEVVCRQHMWHYVFDNSKIKSIAKGWEQTISFEKGIKDTVDWLLEDKIRQRINPEYDRRLMKIYSRYLTGGDES